MALKLRVIILVLSFLVTAKSCMMPVYASNKTETNGQTIKVIITQIYG